MSKIMNAIKQLAEDGALVETSIWLSTREDPIFLSKSPHCDVDKETTKRLIKRKIINLYCEEPILQIEWIGPLKVKEPILWLEVNKIGPGRWTIAQAQ